MSTRKYLSFNREVPDAVDLSKLESVVHANEVKPHLVLDSKWVIWEQIEIPANARLANNDYSENTKVLASFYTVQKFWELWMHIPQPSALVSHKRMVRQDKAGVQHEVDALMIFRDGIKPMWEDDANKNGGHLAYRLLPGTCAKGQMDEYWNNLVLGLIGATIEHGNLITGVRLIDKLNQPKVPNVRIEVWYRSCTEDEVFLLQHCVNDCMARGLDGALSSALRPDIRKH